MSGSAKDSPVVSSADDENVSCAVNTENCFPEKLDTNVIQKEANLEVGEIDSIAEISTAQKANNQYSCKNSTELSVVVDNLESGSTMGDSGILSASEGTPDLNVNCNNGSGDEAEAKCSKPLANGSTMPNGNETHQAPRRASLHHQQFGSTMEPANSNQYNITVLDSANNHSNTPHMSGSQYPSMSAATHSRGNSPRGQNSPPSSQSQHAVLVHVNPGETFSVRVGDQIQHIQGPATVRMVSNNGPPLPMPMQVPPGHMVQQIVDENGILTHVILSPQPPGVHSPPLTVAYYGGSNGMAHQMYPACGMMYGPYQSAPQPQYAGPQPHPHVHPHVHSSPSSHRSCNNHNHPVNHSDDRTLRQKRRLQERLSKRHPDDGNFYQNRIHPPINSPVYNKASPVNGNLPRVDPIHDSSSSGEGQDGDDDGNMVLEMLAMIAKPELTEIEARSALIRLKPPVYDEKEFNIDVSEFKYELYLSEKGRDGRYKLVYSGDATEIALKDLKPATEYFLKVVCLLDDLKGEPTEPVSLKTGSCEPACPAAPSLVNRTKSTIMLKWSAAGENGSKIIGYLLEYDEGRGDSSFVELYNGQQRQHKATKLNPSTCYVFRLAAINAHGRSEFSKHVSFSTSGSIPSQPDPPMMSEQYVRALVISWVKRMSDDEFTLQMEDESTGHGFLPVYNGPELSYKIKQLKRNTEFKFRLLASNEEGASKWSEIVCYRTLPDRPGIPAKPQTKGKVLSHSFRLAWDAPKDDGGSEITEYVVEMDSGKGYEVVYQGCEREHTCDHLSPGHSHRVRVSSISAGGQSEWSEATCIATLPVIPDRCQPPKLQGRPKANSLHLRWNYPDYDGGSQVTEFEVLMTNSDGTSRIAYAGPDFDCAVAGLTAGKTYIFQVRALNKAGAGHWSEVAELQTGAGIPDSPYMPTVQFRSGHVVLVSWDEPSSNGAKITEYRLEWKTRSDGDFSMIYSGPQTSYEVKNLSPASHYSFRVLAVNAAGVGPYSEVCNCTTPAGSPSAVTTLRNTCTATSIHLTWREPVNNGSEITGYNIEVSDKALIAVANVCEYVLDDLLPETHYRVRIQAANVVGAGPFSAQVKITTRPLPPEPPQLECVNVGSNSLKLKWGDGRNTTNCQYTLEMSRDEATFHMVYTGNGQCHKVSRLSELTSYYFRIRASNDAGDGVFSPVCTFHTSRAPPAATRVSRVSEMTVDSCLVEWLSCRPIGADSITYILQLQRTGSAEQDFVEVYRGPAQSYRLEGLATDCEYVVRVCALRVCADGSEPVYGPWSMGRPLRTISLRSGSVAEATSRVDGGVAASAERRQLTDQQWAVIILFAFAIFAVLVAFVAQYIIAYYTSQMSSIASSEDTNPHSVT